MSHYVVFTLLFVITINSISTLSPFPNSNLDNLSKRFLNSNSLNLNNEISNKLETTNLSNFFGSVKSSLFISGAPGKSAMINLKIKNLLVLYSIGMYKKEFVIMSRNENKILTVTAEGQSTLKGNSLMTNTLKVSGPVKYLDVPQWRLIKHDTFYKNNTSLEWSHDIVTECPNHKMMGGYCQTSSKELIKEFKNLPVHSMLRIEASFHFLGNWDSNTGYLKVDPMIENSAKKVDNYVWAHRCMNQKKANDVNTSKINMCGNVKVCKISTPINSTINHSGNSVKLIFGSTLEGNACDQSYGISDVKIYIR